MFDFGLKVLSGFIVVSIVSVVIFVYKVETIVNNMDKDMENVGLIAEGE